VKCGARIVLHEAGLGPEANAAHERVERMHRLLQVHHQLAALVVARPEPRIVVDPADALPATAVIGLHEQWVAELLATTPRSNSLA